MIKEELYNNTVDILVQAYFNDTLEHGNCYACAVGNIIAANAGFAFVNSSTVFPSETLFDEMPYTGFGELYWHKEYRWSDNLVKELRRSNIGLNAAVLNEVQEKHLQLTGYSFEELSQIELAFERVADGIFTTDEEDMFNGLMSVIDALDIIHENTDTTITTSSKNKFAKV